MEPTVRNRKIHLDLDISIWGFGVAIGFDQMDGLWLSFMLGPIGLHMRTRK